MRVPDGLFEEAAAWAGEQLRGRSEDERWALLRELMAAQRDDYDRIDDLRHDLWEQASEPWRGIDPGDVAGHVKREFKDAQIQDALRQMTKLARLEAVQKRVAPNVSRSRWNRGLRPSTDLARWIHTERLRDAAYARGSA